MSAIRVLGWDLTVYASGDSSRTLATVSTVILLFTHAASMSHVYHLSTARPRRDLEPKIFQSVDRPMMHCGGRPSTRCLSGKELRPSGHSGRRCLIASSVTTAPCGAVPPLFSSLLPSTPSSPEVRSHKQEAEVRKKEIPELAESYMLPLTFSPRS